MTRVFDAPRRLVFAAWTDPAHLPTWLGPRGWTLPVCEVDLRPGGSWRFVGRGPDGSDMGMRGVYLEIASPDRLVYTESFDGGSGESLNTVTFVEQDGRTTLTCRVCYPSAEVRDAMLRTRMREGVSEGFERLDEHLTAIARASG